MSLQSTGPSQTQMAEEQLSTLVHRSHVEMWRIGDAWPPAGDHVLLIGVATWSIYDMELLDVLDAKLSRGSQRERIYVFDVDTMDEFDFEEHLPGIGKIFHTPIVANWNNGVLETRLSGASARDWVMQRYGLPPLRSIERFKPKPNWMRRLFRWVSRSR